MEREGGDPDIRSPGEVLSNVGGERILEGGDPLSTELRVGDKVVVEVV